MTLPACRIGCAGWSLPRTGRDAFAADGSHLQRYASRFDASEINSSFHRPHHHDTYRRWADSVPSSFRFSVKLPRGITHERRLHDGAGPLREFFAQASGLGAALGCVLVQLPPSLAFEPGVARRFFIDLRRQWSGDVAVEPRHVSWFGAQADDLLTAHRACRVLADPVLHDAGARPGGWPGLVYLRLHGSPRVYYSAYGHPLLDALAGRLALALREGQPAWCIFDNTAAGAAVDNALSLQSALRTQTP